MQVQTEKTVVGNVSIVSFDQAVELLASSQILSSTDVGYGMTHQIEEPDGVVSLLVVPASGSSFKYVS